MAGLQVTVEVGSFSSDRRHEFLNRRVPHPSPIITINTRDLCANLFRGKACADLFRGLRRKRVPSSNTHFKGYFHAPADTLFRHNFAKGHLRAFIHNPPSLRLHTILQKYKHTP